MMSSRAASSGGFCAPSVGAKSAADKAARTQPAFRDVARTLRVMALWSEGEPHYIGCPGRAARGPRRPVPPTLVDTPREARRQCYPFLGMGTGEPCAGIAG
jgi:hypothetical protein